MIAGCAVWTTNTIEKGLARVHLILVRFPRIGDGTLLFAAKRFPPHTIGPFVCSFRLDAGNRVGAVR